MAEHSVQGNERVVVIGDGGSPETFDTVVCLTSNSFDLSIAEIETATKCGTDYLPGTDSTTVQIEGVVRLDTDADRISAERLFTLAANKTPFNFKYGPLNPVSGDLVRTGTGFFTSYTETDGTNEAATFQGTIRVQGKLTQTVTA